MSSFTPSRNPRVKLQDVLDRIAREGAATRLSLAEATTLVGSRAMDGHDTRRTAENRIRMQICRTLQASARDPNPPQDGTALVGGSDGGIAVDELIRWANERYGALFGDLPKKGRNIPCNVTETVALGGKNDAVTLPGAPERKDQEILRLAAQARELEHRAVMAEREAEAASTELRRRRELGARFKST